MSNKVVNLVTLSVSPSETLVVASIVKTLWITCMCHKLCLRDDVLVTSALRGREGVSQILTKGRKVT